MIKVVIYARHSDDVENDTSIQDQIIACTKEAQDTGIDIFAVYSDESNISSTQPRTGLMALIRDAKAGDFDIVLTEGLDRLSTNDANLLEINKRLVQSHVTVCTLLDGGDLCYQVALEKARSASAELSNLYQMAVNWEQELETLKASEGGQAIEKEIGQIQAGFQSVVQCNNWRTGQTTQTHQKRQIQSKETQMEFNI